MTKGLVKCGWVCECYYFVLHCLVLTIEEFKLMFLLFPFVKCAQFSFNGYNGPIN